MIEKFKESVLRRIDYAKTDVEEAIDSQNEIAYHIALGQLMALSNLASSFDFLSSADLMDLDAFLNESSDRFYR